MRPLSIHPSPTIISVYTVATQSASTCTKTNKATNKKQKQNLNQTEPCTADGEQKRDAKKGEGEL